MKIEADLHTHTTFSHGQGSIEDNVKAAISKGLKVIAISDHGPMHLGFGIKKANYKVMRNIIDDLSPKYPEIKILLGLEANILNEKGQIDVDEELLELSDLVLAGYHFGSSPRGAKDLLYHGLNLMSRYLGLFKRKTCIVNTRAIINAIQSNKITAITHPGAKGPIDVAQIAKIAKQYDVALEINNHHGHLTVEEIKIAQKEGCRFLISSDAHSPEDVGTFENSIKRALDAGLTENDLINNSF